MDCSPPGSFAHGIFQARVLEWVAIAFSNNGVLLNHEKNKIMPFKATWMASEIVILSEVRHRETNEYMISLICGI